MPGRPALRGVFALLFLEAAAFAYAALCLVMPARVAAYAASNEGVLGWRGWLGVVPALCGCGGVALGLTLLRSGRIAGPRLATLSRSLMPLLALWPVPLLLRRDAFGTQPLFLCLVLAACVLGLEASLRRAGPLPAFELVRRSRRSLAASPRLGPRLVAGAAILATLVFGYTHAVRVHDKFLTSNFDFGLFENLFYNALHGRPGIALASQYFSQHAEFLLYVLLPFYWLVPRSETLFFLQTLLIVGAALPLYLLAERWLRSAWGACALAVIYLSSPALHGPLLFDFHFLPLSAFFILWGALFYAKRQWLGFWAMVLLALCCREDVAIGVAAVGGGLALLGRTRRTAYALLVLGAAWFVLVKFVWMARFGPASFSDYYAALIPRGERGFGAVVLTLLSNPLYALSKSLTSDKLLLMLQLFAPLAFLPLRQSKTLFLLVPGSIVVGLSTSQSAIGQVQFHYATHFVPYVFLAALVGLAVRPRVERRVLWAPMVLGALVCSVQFGAFFGPTFKTSFHEVSFDYGPADLERSAQFAALAELIPPEAKLSAGEYEGPHLAERPWLVSAKYGLFDADYVIYSRRSLRWGGAEGIRQALANGGYGALDVRGDFALLRRGASTARNAEALKQIVGLR